MKRNTLPPFKLRRHSGLALLCTEVKPAGGAKALFAVTTRRGGTSFSRGDLNLSHGTGDEDSNVEENRRRLLEALEEILPGSKGIAGLRQRHTADVLHLHEDNHESFLAREFEGDGMATGIPGLWLSISIGDCLPVMISDPRVPALAMAHAGWGGTASRIVEAAVARLVEDFGCDPAGMTAVLGPCIRVARYEVDERVFDRFADHWKPGEWEPFVLERRGAHGYLDLAAANTYLLEASGVPPDNIVDFRLCTGSLPALFFSHRRDGLPGGRMLALGTIVSRR